MAALARLGAKLFGPMLRIGSRVASSGVGKAVGKVAGNKLVRFAAPIAVGELGAYGFRKATGTDNKIKG